jgi:hypothetical protein
MPVLITVAKRDASRIFHPLANAHIADQQAASVVDAVPAVYG